MAIKTFPGQGYAGVCYVCPNCYVLAPVVIWYFDGTAYDFYENEPYKEAGTGDGAYDGCQTDGYPARDYAHSHNPTGFPRDLLCGGCGQPVQIDRLNADAAWAIWYDTYHTDWEYADEQTDCGLNCHSYAMDCPNWVATHAAGAIRWRDGKYVLVEQPTDPMFIQDDWVHMTVFHSFKCVDIWTRGEHHTCPMPSWTWPKELRQRSASSPVYKLSIEWSTSSFPGANSNTWFEPK
jgi:hypothetical protein